VRSKDGKKDAKRSRGEKRGQLDRRGWNRNNKGKEKNDEISLQEMVSPDIARANIRRERQWGEG